MLGPAGSSRGPPPCSILYLFELTTVPRELRARYDGPVPPYFRIYQDAINGHLPATHINGRWYWQPDHLAAIAASYDLRPKNEDAPQAA